MAQVHMLRDEIKADLLALQEERFKIFQQSVAKVRQIWVQNGKAFTWFTRFYDFWIENRYMSKIGCSKDGSMT